MHSSVLGVQLTISIVHPSLTLYEFKGYSHIQVSWITVDLWWSWWTMATTDNKQQSAIVHYCKICHRGFSCGGALGGHMRAHNIAEVINSIQDEQQQQGLLVGDKPEGSKHSYFLRTTSNRFLNLQSPVRGEHSSERASLEDDKLLSPISSSVSKIEDGGAKKAHLWKFLGDNGNENGCFSREEQDLANVLVTLSNNTVDNNMYKNKTKEVSTPLAKGLFQCKACKKVFNSHQALGGHRASHKKVKGCYAAKPDDLTDDEMLEEDDFISHNEISMAQESLDPNFNLNNLTSQNTSHDDHDITREGKVHECSICYRVFSSGQALGGHKRFHWLQTDSTFITPFHDQFQYYGAEDYKKLTTSCSKDSELLDLNLPPDQTVDEKSTTTFLQPSINNVIKINNDEENKGYENCKKIEVCGKRSIKKLQDLGHNYNGEESRLCKLAKHCNVRDLKLDAVSSPWLQVGLASNK
ncbi:Zinc finger protein zat3 [Heracleum sosnowskyi]|uniref:Zinc finger protein zat3 n=1 Tax=Heracleum sosnowskyi TaxID=360622 RepID=A0AAD8HXB9_9APIA|nr:Zinc finger protein zat3 [Heracleum sosnowskyi]